MHADGIAQVIGLQQYARAVLHFHGAEQVQGVGAELQIVAFRFAAEHGHGASGGDVKVTHRRRRATALAGADAKYRQRTGIRAVVDLH